MTAFEGLLLVDQSDRRRLVLTGADRAKFLHNYCTNDIKGLKPGRGCEAFITSPQGKTLGWVTVLASEDHLLVRSDPGGLDLVLPHLAKYSVFDDVAWHDLEGFEEIHVHGRFAGPRLGDFFGEIPRNQLDHGVAPFGPISGVRLIHETRLSPPWHIQLGKSGDIGSVVDGFTALVPVAEVERFHSLISSNGPVAVIRSGDPAYEDVEALRIAAGTPVYGRDITPDNLPQEIGRDAKSISFVKGCYLGQETVARLDALGHVNKLLKSLSITSGGTPRPGETLTFEGAPAGTITSSAAPSDGSPAVALAMVRARAAAVATVLGWSGSDGRSGEAIVTEFP